VRRGPAFSAIAVLTIALGATTAVYSIADAILFRELPVPGTDELVSIDEQRSGQMSMGVEGTRLPYERYEAYADASEDVFSGLAAQRLDVFALRLLDETFAVDGVRTSGNYFSVLGIRPEVGSFYSSDRADEVVISHRLWRERFGSDPATPGRTIRVDGRALTIVGVASASFRGSVTAMQSDVWVPFRATAKGAGASFTAGWVALFGRLRPGVDPEVAAAAVETIALTIPPLQDFTTVRGAVLYPMTGLPGASMGIVTGFMGMLLGTALLVLFIASANLAGMLLARSAARRREFAVRLAIGASRGRLIRHLRAGPTRTAS